METNQNFIPKQEKPIKEENEEGFLGKGFIYGPSSPFQRKMFFTNSKKFTFTKRAIAFSLFYSIIFGLIPTIVSLLFLGEDPSKAEIINRFFSVLVISMLVIFILRVFFKRSMQIFSVSFIGIFVLIILFFWAIIPKERNICTKLEGTFIQSDKVRKGDGRLTSPDYTCFVSKEVFQQVSKNESFPYNFMEFEVKK